jgi:hypothetical protein
MKIRPVRAMMFRADRRTEGRKDKFDKAKSRFLQFWERAKNIKVFQVYRRKHLSMISLHNPPFASKRDNKHYGKNSLKQCL